MNKPSSLNRFSPIKITNRYISMKKTPIISKSSKSASPRLTKVAASYSIEILLEVMISTLFFKGALFGLENTNFKTNYVKEDEFIHEFPFGLIIFGQN